MEANDVVDTKAFEDALNKHLRPVKEISQNDINTHLGFDFLCRQHSPVNVLEKTGIGRGYVGGKLCETIS